MRFIRGKFWHSDHLEGAWHGFNGAGFAGSIQSAALCRPASYLGATARPHARCRRYCVSPCLPEFDPRRPQALSARLLGASAFYRAPFLRSAGDGLLSPEAVSNPPVFVRARAVANFDEGPVPQLVHRLKYYDRMELAKPLGNWMARAGFDSLKQRA